MPSSPTMLAGGQLGLLSRSEVAVAGAAAEDLLEALGRVPAPRDPRGRRYPLVPVLAITGFVVVFTACLWSHRAIQH